MHLHISRVRRNGKVYEYAQLVESYRRPDGMPTQRVVAKLGALSAIAIENLRTSLSAARAGNRVEVVKRARPGATASRPLQNLRYLDLAVLLELWTSSGVGEVLHQLMPRGQADVAAADVVSALAMQRCVDPGSKLFAERWFPRTSLPELLGITPAKFNNTRVHRVLDELNNVTHALMMRLPSLYRQGSKGFRAMFLDVTDTRFVGAGPDLAQLGKTKEGTVERKIGIVLLCSEDGLPLRWHVIAGKRAEAAAMHDLIGEVAGLDWVHNVPTVIDRSMGATAELAKMLARDVHFVTSLRVPEFDSYAPQIPHASLAAIDPLSDDAVERATQAVEASGLKRVSDTMFVRDLGVVERDRGVDTAPHAQQGDDLARFALQTSHDLRAMVERGQADTLAAAARRIGLSPHKAKLYRSLLRLAPELQARILDRSATGLSVEGLIKRVIRNRSLEEQRAAFNHLVVTSSVRGSSAPQSRSSAESTTVPMRVRVVITFNPDRFVDERRTANENLDEVQAEVRRLNAKLAHPNSRRTRASVEAELDRMLRRRSFLDVYETAVHERARDDGSAHWSASATLDTRRWGNRRRFDGFSVIISHPDLAMDGADLAKLYRSRDAIEKDFQIIKSLVALRPVWHRTDDKVRAHVTICMLALLLERLLSKRLRSSTSTAALESLASCCLNRFAGGAYLLTEPDAEQTALLRQLRMPSLVDQQHVVERLRPRPSDDDVVSTPT